MRSKPTTMPSKAPKAEIVRHTRALDELLWKIYVYLVDPQLVITTEPPRDKPLSQPIGEPNGRNVHN
jgi:hypothetical protein